MLATEERISSVERPGLPSQPLTSKAVQAVRSAIQAAEAQMAAAANQAMPTNGPNPTATPSQKPSPTAEASFSSTEGDAVYHGNVRVTLKDCGRRLEVALAITQDGTPNESLMVAVAGVVREAIDPLATGCAYGMSGGYIRFDTDR